MERSEESLMWESEEGNDEDEGPVWFEGREGEGREGREWKGK